MSGRSGSGGAPEVSYGLEVVTLPVTDVDRALAFYTDVLQFTLDVDYAPTAEFRVVQLTPPGSDVSVQLGLGLTDAQPGSVRATYLVVTDLEEARRRLTARGLAVSEPCHKSRLQDWEGGFEQGVDPDRRDYASFAGFADPDGNTWVLQERGFHADH